MKTIITLMAVGLLAAGSVAAQEEAVTDVDRFELWTECKPVRLLVENLGEDAAVIGLSREDITVAARSRLRAARIYTPDRVDYKLYIRVSTVGCAFSMSIEFQKRLEDSNSRQSYLATTWNTGSTGTHGKTGKSYILSGLSRHIDRFIDEYLRVNAEACS